MKYAGLRYGKLTFRLWVQDQASQNSVDGGIPFTLLRQSFPFRTGSRMAQMFRWQDAVWSVSYAMSGITRDSSGAVLPLCLVKIYRTADNVEIGDTVSDSLGQFAFQVRVPGLYYYLVAYKVGSPDVMGTTVNTLTAV